MIVITHDPIVAEHAKPAKSSCWTGGLSAIGPRAGPTGPRKQETPGFRRARRPRADRVFPCGYVGGGAHGDAVAQGTNPLRTFLHAARRRPSASRRSITMLAVGPGRQGADYRRDHRGRRESTDGVGRQEPGAWPLYVRGSRCRGLPRFRTCTRLLPQLSEQQTTALRQCRPGNASASKVHFTTIPEADKLARRQRGHSFPMRITGPSRRSSSSGASVVRRPVFRTAMPWASTSWSKNTPLLVIGTMTRKGRRVVRRPRRCRLHSREDRRHSAHGLEGRYGGSRFGRRMRL